MKSRICILLILACALSGCTLPALKPEPTVNYIDTQVSIALTAYPSNTPQPLPSFTAEPTGTPAIAIPTETPASTSVPPTVTLIPPVDTPTPNITDPAQVLGLPAWKDALDNGTNWGLDASGYSDDNTSIKIENGRMTFVSQAAISWLGWRLGGHQVKDAYIEANFTTHSCAGSDTYGLILRAPEYTSGQGYYYKISCDGQYALSVTDAAGSSELHAFTSNPAILPGPNQNNRIGIWLNGSQIKLYSNGILLDELTDSVIGASGHIGFFITGKQTPGFSYSVDEISTWTLP